MKIALIQSNNGYDNSRNTRYLPPVGLLMIAEYLEAQLTGISVTVYDERTGNLDYEAISKCNWAGLPLCWSNYSEAVSIAEKIKYINNKIKIVVGGPNTQDIAPRILKNNPFIDFAVIGDGERPFLDLINGNSYHQISGLVFREGKKISINPPDFTLDLDDIPIMSLNQLYTKEYLWDTFKGSIHNYFPIARNKGCFRKKRCDLCSIPVANNRSSSAEIYWSEIQFLRNKYGVDHYFDTGDIFPTKKLDEYLQAKPPGLTDVYFRCYFHPEMISHDVAEKMHKMGFKNAFIGVENYRYFMDAENRLSGRYSRNYSIDQLIDEIEIFGKHGITVTPSYVLGIPGETELSLQHNAELIKKTGALPNVKEMEVNLLKLFPGSNFFRKALEDPTVLDRYCSETGLDLKLVDNIDYNRLSEIFIDTFNIVSHRQILSTIKSLYNELKPVADIFSFEKLRDS